MPCYAEAAIEITTKKIWRVVSMHGLNEAVVLALELDDKVAQHTASIRLLFQKLDILEMSAAVDEWLHIFVTADGRRYRISKIDMDEITND
jgi:hypothetical protein